MVKQQMARLNTNILGIDILGNGQEWVNLIQITRLPGEISITSDRQTTPPLGQKVKKN